MDRRDFLKLSGISLLSVFLPNIQIGEGMTTYTEMMMKVINNEPLSAIDKEQLRVMFQEMDNNRQIVSAWQNVDKKVSSNFIDFPISVIYSEVLEADITSFSIEIPKGFSHLLFLSMIRTDLAAFNDGIAGRFNDDSGNNYSIISEGAQATSQIATQNKTTRSSFDICVATGASATSGAMGSSFSFIPHYNSSTWKSVITTMATAEYSSSDLLILNSPTFWRDTTPVNKITVFSSNGANILAGSLFSIYGLR